MTCGGWPLGYRPSSPAPRCSVPSHAGYVKDGGGAKRLERELGVTYKAAWRMFNKIRTELMGDDDEGQLGGDVEVDETSWGGKPRHKLPARSSELAKWREFKTTVLGVVERDGRVRLRVIPCRRGRPLIEPCGPTSTLPS